nr:immunoglobulin heavy chain junction region [Homo sapiens]
AELCDRRRHGCVLL